MDIDMNNNDDIHNNKIDDVDNVDDDDDNDDDDDEIIREIDVYISNNHLNTYLLQFPTKPVYSDAPDITNAKIKPKHQKLNIDISLSSKNAKYVQPYISSKLAQRASLGVGVIHEGAMYVTPLSQVLQMKPSFEHIPSKKDDDDKDEERYEYDDDDDYKKKDQEKVGLQKKESDRSQVARLKSYQYQQTQEDNEPYQKLRVCQIDSNESLSCIDKMIQTGINSDIAIIESKEDS
jgi:hypothetical protein